MTPKKESRPGKDGSKQEADSALLSYGPAGAKNKYVHGEGSRNARRMAMFDTDGNLRNRPSTIYHPVKPTTQFTEHVRQEVIPYLRLGERLQERKRDYATGILANLYLAHRAGGKVLADSRNTGRGADSQARARVRIYDELERMGFIRKHTGSEQSGQVTRYALRPIEAWTARQWDFLDVVDPSLDEPTSERYQPSEFAPVILRPSKDDEPGHKYTKRSLPLPPTMSEKERGLVRDLERILMEINRDHLTKHAWAYTILHACGQPVALHQVNPVMRAIFNGDFQHGGRFYSRGVNGYQNLSKPERRTMLIDGEGIAERDYSGFHTRLLYHKEGIDYRGDVYCPAEVLPRLYRGHHPQAVRKAGRKYIKTLTNIILNASTLGKAIGAAKKALQDNSLYGQALDICGTTPEKMILRITRIHKPIAHHFHTGTGLSLQCEDAFLVLWTMQYFHAQGKPALSLHDAILCKESDAELAEDSMHEVYSLMYGFAPEIKADWPLPDARK